MRISYSRSAYFGVENMKSNNEIFEYIYSAPQQEDFKQIREKYLPRE